MKLKKRILIKIGTNVLTRSNLRLDYNRIYDLVPQIVNVAKDNEVILVTSGARAAGREFFLFSEEKDPLIQKQMLASVGQGKLFQIYSDFFQKNGFLSAQALLTKNDFELKESYINIKTTLEGLLRNRILPIVNENDVTSSQASTFGDNDQLAALTAALLESDELLILTDIDGLYTSDPKKNTSAKLISEVDEITQDLISLCENTISQGGTGGMYSKLKAAELATQHGIKTRVLSGKNPNCIINAMKSPGIGTTFLPKNKKKLSTKGSWMTTAAEIQGGVTVDKGAFEALIKNKSLLAVGIKDSQGNFKKGDVILIQDERGFRIGVGLANMSMKNLQDLKRKNDAYGNIVIQKNHLYKL